MEAVARLIFQRGDRAVALQFVRLDVGLGTAKEEIAAGRAFVGEAPGVVALVLRRRVGGRDADGDAEGVIGELVDISRRGAVAVAAAIGVELVLAVHLAAQLDRDDAVLLRQRAQHAQIDRAGDTGCDQRGGRRLVDDDVLEELGRVLVVLDAAVVTDGDLLAAIEQRGAEVRAEAADREALVTAFEALRGDAGQAGERVRDRDVGQLADVFSRKRFDDGRRSALDRGRGIERGAVTGDNDRAFIGGGCFGGGLRRGVLRKGRRGERGSGQRNRRTAQKAGATDRKKGVLRHGNQISPMWPVRGRKHCRNTVFPGSVRGAG